jgi:CDP-glucose 4,6-dehydratase
MVLRGFWNNKNVLITGHTGFKGSWLSLWLNSLGSKVYGYSLAPNTSPSLYHQLNLEKAIDSKIGDICDKKLMKKYINYCSPEIIFHLAAQPLVLSGYEETYNTWNTNVMGTVNLLETLRENQSECTVVVITTDKVYENLETGRFYSEKDRLGGKDPYSASKSGTELVVQSYRNIFHQEGQNVNVVSARAGNVIGGGDWAENRLIPDIIRALECDRTVGVRNQNSIRPWQHVLEPLSGYLLLAQKVEDRSFLGDTLNFGPNDLDAKSVIDVVKAALKSWPGNYSLNPQENAPSEAGLLMLSIENAQREIGWFPKWDFDKAIIRTMDWYKANNDNKDMLDFSFKQIKEYEDEY